jgi:hypothetical protein
LLKISKRHVRATHASPLQFSQKEENNVGNQTYFLFGLPHTRKMGWDDESADTPESPLKSNYAIAP